MYWSVSIAQLIVIKRLFTDVRVRTSKLRKSNNLIIWRKKLMYGVNHNLLDQINVMGTNTGETSRYSDNPAYMVYLSSCKFRDHTYAQ